MNFISSDVCDIAVEFIAVVHCLVFKATYYLLTLTLLCAPYSQAKLTNRSYVQCAPYTQEWLTNRSI